VRWPNAIHFIEVKTRKWDTDLATSPFDYFKKHQASALLRSAKVYLCTQYLQQGHEVEFSYRFDGFVVHYHESGRFPWSWKNIPHIIEVDEASLPLW